MTIKRFILLGMKTRKDDVGRGSQSEWSLMNRSPMKR
jgi:hypothetical protein